MDELTRAINRELARRAGESDKTIKRSAPRVRDLPEPQFPPSNRVPIWWDILPIRNMMLALGWEQQSPEPEPPEKNEKRVRDTPSSLRRAQAETGGPGNSCYQEFPLRVYKPKD